MVIIASSTKLGCSYDASALCAIRYPRRREPRRGKVNVRLRLGLPLPWRSEWSESLVVQASEL